MSIDFNDGLLAALVARDDAAQAQVYRVMYPQLMLEARRVLSEQDAEDIVQIAFTRFLSGGVDALRHPRAIPNFLRILVRRRALDLTKYQARRRSSQSAALESLVDLEAEPAFEKRLLYRDLSRCLSALDAVFQRTIAVLYLQGRSYRKAETALGVGRDTIGRRHKNALHALETCMGAREDANDDR